MLYPRGVLVASRDTTNPPFEFFVKALLHLGVEAATAEADFSSESFGCGPRLIVKGLQHPRGWGLSGSGRAQAPAGFPQSQCIHCKL